jgi:hypothetical protein
VIKTKRRQLSNQPQKPPQGGWVSQELGRFVVERTPICNPGHIRSKVFLTGAGPDPQQAELEMLLQIKAQNLSLKTEQLWRKLQADSDTELVAKLQDRDRQIRYLVTVILGRRRVHAEKELIERLSDPVAEVREAAHHALIRLCRGTDLGPSIRDSQASIQPAIRRWTRWLEAQDPIKSTDTSLSRSQEPSQR